MMRAAVVIALAGVPCFFALFVAAFLTFWTVALLTAAVGAALVAIGATGFALVRGAS